MFLALPDWPWPDWENNFVNIQMGPKTRLVPDCTTQIGARLLSLGQNNFFGTALLLGFTMVCFAMLRSALLSVLALLSFARLCFAMLGAWALLSYAMQC